MANRNPGPPRPAAFPIAALVILALWTGSARSDEQATVTILHTTDLHGHLLPEDDYSGDAAPRGLARVATLVRQARAADPEALLLDAGDCIQGAPLEFVAHTKLSDLPDPMMAAMNALGYSAMAVGNHEYDFGWRTLETAHKAAKFPWLSANTLRGATPAFDPYKVFVVHGVRVGVLGLTTPAIPHWTDTDKYPGLSFADAVETAKKWVPILRGKERCDVVVVLTHQGLERESQRARTSSDDIAGENAGYALAEVPGVDVVIMGHTHRAIPSMTVKGTLLSQAGRWADRLGRIELSLSRAKTTDRWKLDTKRADMTAVTLDTPADTALMTLAAPYRAATREWLDTPLGTADGDFDGSKSRIQDTALMDLVHAAQLRYGNADVSMAAAFGTDARLRKGPILMRDVYAIYVYENTLYTLEVTGKQLRQALEWAARYYSPYDFGRNERPLADPSVQGFNYDMAQGVNYTIDISRPVGDRIRDLRFGGRALSDDMRLKVAVNSYRVNGGGGYDMWKGARVIARSEVGMRELLARYIKDMGTIRPRVDDNWRLVPLWAADPSKPLFERLVRRGVWSEDESKLIDPAATLTRGAYAGWLGRAYGAKAAGATRFEDVKPEMTGDVAAAERAGALASEKGTMLRPTEPLDLLTAVEWTVLADHGGALPKNWTGQKKPPAKADADIYFGPSGRHAPSDVLKLAQAPPRYGRPRLPLDEERFALERGFLDEWRADADPLAPTNADGARLLAAARYPWVTILYTTDFHGAFEAQPRDRTTNRQLGSSPALAALIFRERARNPYGTMLLDGGDLMQGTMQSNLSRGRPVIAQMNRLGYDATSLGNHEFDWGVDTLMARVKEARFPFLSANIFDKGTTRTPPWLKPAGIFERHGLEIGVVGFSTTETPTVTMPSNVARYEFPVEAPIAARWIPRLRALGADAIVLMGHLPASQDSTGEVKGELARLAQGVEGEDVVLGGHSHNLVDGEVGGVPVMISSSQARALGRVDLIVDRKAGKAVERSARNLEVDTDAIAADKAMAGFVDSLLAALRPSAERVLCDAPEDLGRDRRGESRVGDWVADVMRAKAGADAAFQNPGGLRADLAAGPVTVKDVYEVMPFDNRIALVHLTGAQLLEAVETGVRGEGCPQVSGIRFAFDRSRPRGERVVKLEFADGRAVDPAATYLVATNDFMAQGGDGYDIFAKASDLRVTEDLVRDALVADGEARAKRGEKLLIKLDGRIQDVTQTTATKAAPAESSR